MPRRKIETGAAEWLQEANKFSIELADQGDVVALQKPYLVWRCDDFSSKFQLGRFWFTQSGVKIDQGVELS